MAVIRIPGPLRKHTDGQAEVTVEGQTVSGVLQALESRFPDIHDRLYDPAGELRPFINIYLNEADIRFDQGLATPVSDSDDLSIVPAVAGGGGD